MAVSPESAGNFSTKKRRRHNPAASAKTGLEKIRFIGATHLTIEPTESRRGRFSRSGERRSRRIALPAGRRAIPKVKQTHERTKADLLRCAACALAPHPACDGNQRSPAHFTAGLFFCDDRRQRGIACQFASGHKVQLSPAEDEEESGFGTRRAAAPRGQHRNCARQL